MVMTLHDLQVTPLLLGNEQLSAEADKSVSGWRR